MSKSDVRNLVKHSLDIFEKGTLQEQRTLVRSLINKITLKGEEIIIHWAFL